MMFDSPVSYLDEPTRAATASSLVARTADALDLYNAAKVAHWSVRGPHFGDLHALFGEVADLLADQADMFAERAATLGAPVQVTTQAVVATSRMEPYPRTLTTGTEHITALAERLKAYLALLCDLVCAATAVRDVSTANLVTDAMGAAEKLGWKLMAHTQAPA
jgi:starvation-inducible DNA-binding protein